MERHRNVANENEIEWVKRERGDPVRRRQLSAKVGASMIGCSVYEVPPGSKTWPFHYHCANEEAVYVLDGQGTARLADAEVAIGAGDYLVFPRGDGGAHQIVNRSDAPLRYLCFSTMVEPDVTVYPDSEKIGVFAGAAPGGREEDRYLSRFLDFGAEVDYWADEEEG